MWQSIAVVDTLFTISTLDLTARIYNNIGMQRILITRSTSKIQRVAFKTFVLIGTTFLQDRIIVAVNYDHSATSPIQDGIEIVAIVTLAAADVIDCHLFRKTTI